MNKNKIKLPKIKPCPFCGNKKCYAESMSLSNFKAVWRVACGKCYVVMPITGDAELAINNWNKRAPAGEGK